MPKYTKTQDNVTFTIDIKTNGKVNFSAKMGNKVLNEIDIKISDIEGLENRFQVLEVLEARGYQQTSE